MLENCNVLKLIYNCISGAYESLESYIVYSVFFLADELMHRVIYKSTYRNLFLFQKTLQEYAQYVLAEAVPVRQITPCVGTTVIYEPDKLESNKNTRINLIIIKFLQVPVFK